MVAANADRRGSTSLVQWCLDLIALVLRIALWPVRRMSDLLLPAGEFDGLSPAVTEKAAQQFVNHLKTLASTQQQTSAISPAMIQQAFSTMGFAALKQEANATHSLLVIYLHSPLHRQANQNCQKLLLHPSMLEFLSQDNVKALGSSIHTSQGASLSQQLGASCFPMLVVLQPSGSSGRSSENVKLVFKAEGPTLLRMQPTQLLPLLHGTFNRHQMVVAEQVARRVEREQETELRRQQDEEYQEALQADQERERLQREERELEERRVREEEEKERQKDQAEQQRLENAKNLLRPAPAAGGTRIRFVLPSGKKLDRRFENEETIASLKAFLTLHFAEQEKTPEIRNFGLSTNFPKKSYSDDDDKTLNESDLSPQAVLMVQDLDA